MHRILDGRKRASSSSGGSSGSSGSASYSYTDDFFHPTGNNSTTEYGASTTTTTNSTSVFSGFQPDESTLSAAIQTIKWSAVIAGVGFILFAAFIMIAAVIRKVNIT